ncbi:hypothetical protein OROMI_005516 [Orobanche minor]
MERIPFSSRPPFLSSPPPSARLIFLVTEAEAEAAADFNQLTFSPHLLPLKPPQPPISTRCAATGFN